MQYRTLGRTGIRVSPYALGAMMFGQIGNADHDDSTRIIHRALDAGINLIDTADVYSGGESEEIVGHAIKDRRDDVVLATKVGNPTAEAVNHRGGSRRWISSAVEASLRRLGTDHVDLLQLHRPDPETDLAETLSAMSDLVRAGKVRAIGTSKQPAIDIVDAQWIAERRGLERFRCEQPPYSILDRGIERDVLPAAQRYGMGTVVFSPLAQGLLTGRVRRGQPSQLRRGGAFHAHLTDPARIDAVEKLVAVADGAGVSLTHLAMGFAIAHPGVTAALLGPRTAEQLDDLLAGADFRPTDDVLDAIDAIVPPGTDVGHLDMSYDPPAVTVTELRRRPIGERAAA